MNLDGLNKKLEQMEEKLPAAEEQAEEQISEGFAEVRAEQRPPAGDGSCSRMDYLAEQGAMEENGIAAEACQRLDLVAEQGVAVEACPKLDLVAVNPEASVLDKQQQSWLDRQPEASPSFTGKVFTPCIGGSVKCVGCAGDLLGKTIECRGATCVGPKKHPDCPNGKRYPS